MANFQRPPTGPAAIEFAKVRNGYSGGSIWNDGAVDIHILFDNETDASGTQFSFKLRPGAYFEVPDFWIGRLTAWSSASSVMNVTMRDEAAFMPLEGLD